MLDDGRVVETGSHEELMVADDSEDEMDDHDNDHRHHRIKGAYRELVLGKERAKSPTSESVKGGGGGGEEETDDGGGTGEKKINSLFLENNFFSLKNN